MESYLKKSGTKQTEKMSKWLAGTSNALPPILEQILMAPIYITVQTSSNANVSLLWTKPKMLSMMKSEQEQRIEYQITAMNIATGYSFLTDEYNQNSLKLPFRLKHGYDYRFTIVATSLGSTDVCVGTGSIVHRAVFSPSELNELLYKAISFVQEDNPYPIDSLYRTKPSSYFQDIFDKRYGFMEVYDKDHSGDPASPINGQLQGLFFSTEAHPITGALPKVSPFGTMRLVLPTHRLVTPSHNLYFADFYCSTKKHLVTLVLAKRGSPANNFCSRRLVELPLLLQGFGNPFLFKDAAGQFYCSKKVTVEIFYTENIDVAEEVRRNSTCLRKVRPIGRGRSIPGSKPKKSSCVTCNLYPELE